MKQKLVGGGKQDEATIFQVCLESLSRYFDSSTVDQAVACASREIFDSNMSLRIGAFYISILTNHPCNRSWIIPLRFYKSR